LESCGIGFSRPGKPSDNALVEAFNSRFRQECLNQHCFLSLEDAKEKLNAWQNEYNTERPHSALGYRTPLQGRTKTINVKTVAA
jgi:putative transposase